MRKQFIFFSVSVLLGIVSMSAGSACAALISGTIRNAAGFPVRAVTVTLQAPCAELTATTDEKGNYQFPDFVAACPPYTISPSKPNYSFKPLSVNFSPRPITPPVDFTAFLEVPSDFDGDFRTDLAVVHRMPGSPGAAVWRFIRSQTSTIGIINWGFSTDFFVPGDYDDDNKTDVAIVRGVPRTGQDIVDAEWWLNVGPNGLIVERFGYITDRFVPRDYDGDGETDLAAIRPDGGQWTWFLDNSSLAHYCAVRWGFGTDKLVPADYDGDGLAEVSVFRPSNGFWYILNQDCPASDPPRPLDYLSIPWGVNTDIPVPGDYDGDGKTDVAVFRPTEGTWYILQSSTGTPRILQQGTFGDIPVPGDYDGDAKYDVAVFSPQTATWSILPSSGGTVVTTRFGESGDIPVPALYTSDAQSQVRDANIPQ